MIQRSVFTLVAGCVLAATFGAPCSTFAQSAPPAPGAPVDGPADGPGGAPDPSDAVDTPSAPAFEARIPVRVIAGKLVARVELSTRFRRIAANLWIDLDRPISFELHNRAADPLGVDRGGGQPITVHLLGNEIVIPGREHGDEEGMEDFTKLYSRELGEVALVGTIGAKVLEQYHLVLDVADGFLTISSPRERTGVPPADEPGSVLTSITLTNDLVWFPVRLADGGIRAMALGTSRYDSVIDIALCEDLDRPAGDIGPVVLKTLDLHGYVAFRPEPIVQVHADGALGVAGINLLEHFRVEIDRVNRSVRFTETVPAEFPAADLAYFRARATEEPEPLLAFLDEHGETRLAREAAELLLELQLEYGADAEECRTALEWMDKTRIEDLRTTEAIETMKVLVEAGRPDVAIVAGKIGVDSGRKDRYPEAVHKLHTELGSLLLDREQVDEAWEHLLSAAFGLPDDGEVNLLLGELYEAKERWRRAQSRYIQAVIQPETGPQAIAGLERVQRSMEGEPLSVDLVDRMVRGKVHNFSAATEFEPTEETDTTRCVLVELFTNPHFGRKLTEGWRSFAVGGAMGAEGLLSHFPRDRVVVVSHHLEQPEPCATMTELGLVAAQEYGVQGPVAMAIDGRQFGPGAGRWREAEQIYEENRGLVMAELARPTDYAITIDAELTGEGSDAVGVRGTVRVEGPDDTLRRVQVLLVERGVLYPGKAQVVVHRNLVRGSLVGSVDGVRFDPVDGAQAIEFTRTLADITARNVEHLDRYEEGGGGAASRLSVAIDPRQVSVVAFVRDATNGEILQAAQLDLGDPTAEETIR